MFEDEIATFVRGFKRKTREIKIGKKGNNIGSTIPKDYKEYLREFYHCSEEDLTKKYGFWDSSLIISPDKKIVYIVLIPPKNGDDKDE